MRKTESLQTSLLSASLSMGVVHLRRLLFSRQTLVCMFLFGLAMLAAVIVSMRRELSVQRFLNSVTPAYIAFLMPAFCLSYATACVASDREEETLLYSLVTPVPRSINYLVRLTAALILSLCWSVGGLAILCRLLGAETWAGFGSFWTVAFWSTLAYVSLFGFFSVVFRRATVVTLIYVFFVEDLWSNVPGTAKRVAVSFYTRCLFIDSGKQLGAKPPSYLNMDVFMPITGDAAVTTLLSATIAFAILGTVFFARKEY